MEFSNKRSRDDFEQDEGQFHDGPSHDSFDHKRHHIDPAQELINNICKDIRRLGEAGDIENLIADTNYISNPIVAEFEKIDNLRNSILSTIYALITEQPHKISAIANLILICNAKNFVIAKYVIEYLHSKMQTMLDSQEGSVFNDIKNILKFLSTLTPIIEDNGIIQIFKQFLNFAIELQEQTEVRNGLAQEIYYNVLIAIPYVLSNDNSDDLKKSINELIELARNFKIVAESATVLLPFDTRMGNFELPYIPKQMTHLDPLSFPMYNNTTEYETVPPIETYLGLFFKDIAFDILTNLSFNKNETAIELSILDMFFDNKLFAPPGTSIDQLNAIYEDNKSGTNDPSLSTWKIEDVAVESILTMIFQLPNPLEVEIYYYTVLISCCRESPESIAPVFGRAIRYFYNHLETLDYELKIRFLDWMSIQLSNFEFSWKWEEWVSDSKKLKDLKYHPKKNFIKNLIAKEIRLSNKKRIKDSFIDIVDGEVVNLDEFYQYLDISMVPDVKSYIISYDTELYGESSRDTLIQLYEQKQEQLNSKSNIGAQNEIFFNFTNSELPFHETASKVYDFILTHWKSNTDFNELYKSVLESITAPNNERFAINLIIQTILSRDINKLKFLSGAPIDYVGDEARFEDLHFTEEEKQNRQNWIIEAVFRIWIHQPQVVFLILEYLIEFGIIDPKYILVKALESNLIIDNVSCMESINRILSKAESKELIIQLFTAIIDNLNKLELDKEKRVEIEEVTESNATEVDKQWLFYEYLGLLKSYYRKYIIGDVECHDKVKEIVGQLENASAKDEILKWFG
ncbi:MIF4G like family protein [Candida albicans]|uniref:Nuclear cap-binding protein complex subunit 1 n=1 Tax=Candida albicans TaxID=5476 RepID=A0A8H6F264_CANAX|nr:MIF4G like family protein [Candida albicans]